MFIQNTCVKLYENQSKDEAEWSGNAMVLGKLPVLGNPTSLEKSRTRAYYACSRCTWGCFDIFLSSISSLFILPSVGWLVVLGLTVLSDSISVYTRPSQKKERKDR